MSDTKRRKVTTALFDPVKTMATITDRVLVGVSGGKDSIVTLDLCCRYFKHVSAFFMYFVPGLGFQERFMRYLEEKYDIKILRMPHFMMSDFYRYGTFRPPDFNVRIVATREAYNYAREWANTWWIACGERISDSMVRRAMIKSTGSIEKKRGRFFPIAYWNKPEIMDYIRVHRLRLSEENSSLGFSFRSFMPQDMIAIRDRFPKDYERIKHYFPLLDASIKNYEYRMSLGEEVEEATLDMEDGI